MKTMRKLTIALGTRDSGQTQLLAAAKLHKGKAVRCCSFWDQPFDQTKTGLYAKLAMSLIELKCGTVQRYVWDMSWLELGALAQLQLLPADLAGYGGLVEDLLAFNGEIQFVHMQPSEQWLAARLSTDKFSEYWRLAVQYRQSTEDLAVLTHIDSGLATLQQSLPCAFDTVRFGSAQELSQEAARLFA